MRLKGKVAIITGGGSGIGRATAILFAREGARVMVADYGVDGGEKTVQSIVASGGVATFFQVDVSDVDRVDDLVAQTVRVFGGIDVLCNCGGCGG